MYYTPLFVSELPRQVPQQVLPSYNYPHHPMHTLPGWSEGFGQGSTSEFQGLCDTFFGGSPSLVHGVDLNTPPAHGGPPYVIPDDIPHIHDLVGVDLGAQFSAEVSSKRQQQP